MYVCMCVRKFVRDTVIMTTRIERCGSVLLQNPSTLTIHCMCIVLYGPAINLFYVYMHYLMFVISSIHTPDSSDFNPPVECGLSNLTSNLDRLGSNLGRRACVNEAI